MISVKNLTKTYKTQKSTGNIVNDFFNRQYKSYTAVKNISFEIREGELIGFIGPNGAGKTTLVRHFNGLLQPTSGSVMIGDWETKKQSVAKLASRVGYVFADFHLELE